MRITPGAAPAFALITVLTTLLALGGCGQRSILMLEESGMKNLERGRYAEAASDFEESIDRSPGRYESRVGMGRALLALDRPRHARDHLEVAHTLFPDRDAAVGLLAEAMHRGGDTGAAMRFLRERAEERQSPVDWVRFGRFAARTGDADTAERALLTAARIDGGVSVEPQFALAEFYAAIGDEPRAIKRLRMASWLDAGDQRVIGMIRDLGGTPGPTFVQVPAERE